MAADRMPAPGAIRANRPGFALLLALLALVVVVMVGAAVVGANAVPPANRARVNAAAELLTLLTETQQSGLVQFNADVGNYPRTLSQLTRPITLTDIELCSTKTYSKGAVDKWGGPYIPRVLPASGTQMGIGVARDTLVAQALSGNSKLMTVVIPTVDEADAKAVDELIDLGTGSATGKARWTTADANGVVTFNWVTEVSPC